MSSRVGSTPAAMGMRRPRRVARTGRGESIAAGVFRAPRYRHLRGCGGRGVFAGFLFTAGLLIALPVHAQLKSNEQSARSMRLERFVLPEFPPFLRQTGVVQGTVVTAIGRSRQGRADDVLVLESTDPRFSAAAIEAIREWRFKPLDRHASAEEEPVPVVRFLFSTGAVAVVPLSPVHRGGERKIVRAETPIELPNFSHLDKVPPALVQRMPEFPASLRNRVSHGIVVVKYYIDATGRVRLPVIVSTSEAELGAAALDAVREWRYEPPRIDGNPVIALERHTFEFGQRP